MTLAFTYANEWEDYTITEEAQNDPTFRDELIALGLDPETGSGQWTPVGARRGLRTQHRRRTCWMRGRDTSQLCMPNKPGDGSAATSTISS